jgi:diguanylate cyclase (GGDEF)-like protein
MTQRFKLQTVLIVDDSPINLQVLARSLSDTCQVKIASNGLKALELVETHDIDLVLLDIMMPDMDGYEVCRKLKSNKTTMDIPIIFVTARNEMEEEKRGLSLGAVDYITKPFHIPIVRARVETHLRLRRKTRLLEQMASIDGLTEIPNRRSFDAVLMREWGRAKREREPLTILMVDVDYFKQYNDSEGHAAGDQCLKRLARHLSMSLKRSTDFLARYGGEEFGGILPNTDLIGAKSMANDMLNAVAALKMPHPDSDISPYMTVSIGVAVVMPGPSLDATKALKAADDMLYRAKEAGRNQYKIATL